MHEASLVAELVDACVERAAGARVDLVRVRRAATAEADAVEGAFRLLTAGTALAGAVLELEPVELHLDCGCGFTDALGPGDTAGGFAVCPGCGAVSPRPPGPELELLEVRTATAG